MVLEYLLVACESVGNCEQNVHVILDVEQMKKEKIVGGMLCIYYLSRAQI